MRLSIGPKTLFATMSFFLVAALFGFSLLFLPQRVATKLSEAVTAQTGYSLAANGGSRLTFEDGFAAILEDVTVSIAEGQSRPAMTAKQLRVPLDWAALFHLSSDLPTVIAEEATLLLPLDGLSGEAKALDLKPTRLELRDSTVKLEAQSGAFSATATDVNGTLQAGPLAATAELRGLLNGRLTEFSMSLDSIAKLRSSGTPADVNLRSEAHALNFSGRIRATDKAELDGRLGLTTDKALDFLAWIGLASVESKRSYPLSLDAALSSEGPRVVLKDANLDINGVLAKGSATVTAGGERPLLTGAVQFEEARLAQIWPNPSALTPPASLSSPWPQTPFAMPDLAAFDGELSLTAKTFSMGDITFAPLKIETFWRDGEMTISMSDGTATTEHLSAVFSVSAAKGRAQWTAKGKVKDIDLSALLAATLNFSAVSGRTTSEFDVEASGGSLAEIISTLRGTTRLSVDAASLSDLSLGKLLAREGAGWGTTEGDSTTALKSETSLTLDDGLAIINGLSLSANDLSLKASGEVDLLRQALDLEVRPRGANLPDVLTITGPWTKPTVKHEARPARPVLPPRADAVAP